MCRYAYKTYKPHFVCFDCRKQFKRPPLRDVLSHQGRLATLQRLERAHGSPAARAKAERATGTTIEQLRCEYRKLVSRCPQCGGGMAELGLDFKPPPSSSVRAWARLHAMYELGHAWHTCGCNGPGFVPVDATAYAEYLATRAREFSDKIKRVQRSKTLDQAARVRELAYWSDLLARVQGEMS